MRTLQPIPAARKQERGRIVGFRVGLKWARKCHKLTQEELAALATVAAREATGDPDARVSPSLIAMIEIGKREPSWEVATWIARAFKCEVKDLATIIRDAAA